MNPIRRHALALAAVLSIAVPALAAQKKLPKPAPKEHVVIQISDNDPKRWNLVLNVAGNIQKELGADKVEVEIVAYGPGIQMLRADSETANRLEDAMTGGVQVAACANSMRGQNLKEDDLVKKAVVVPAGAVQIMKRQRQGWTYLRP